MSESQQTESPQEQFPVAKRAIAGRKPKIADYEIEPVCRKVKTYRITESELKNLAIDNTVASNALSTGCSIFTFAVGLVCSLYMESTPTDLAVKLTVILTLICVAISAVCFGTWKFTRNKRKIELDGILIEMEDSSR